MERRSRFFGALAGLGMVFGVPSYYYRKELEQVERGGRVVMEAVVAGRASALTADQVDAFVLGTFDNYQAEHGRAKEYKVEDVRTTPYGPSAVRGLVKRGNRWFRFEITGDYLGRPSRYDEEPALFSD